VVWTSEDGFTWTRLPHDEEAFAHSFMSEVAAGPNGFVAAGQCLGPDRYVLWHSPDGSTWTRLDIGLGSDPWFDRVPRLIAGGPGYVWASQGTVWLSADGISWTYPDIDPVEAAAETHGRPHRAWIRGVAASAEGLVAVGNAQLAENSPIYPALWTSVDGMVWEHEALGPGIAVASEISVRRLRPRAVAAIGDATIVMGGGAIWTTTP
jgi:hypothetical protein